MKLLTNTGGIPRLILLLTSAVLLAACSSNQYQGQGEYFALANRHVLEMDLSILKPTVASQTRLSAEDLARKQALAQSQVSERNASPLNDKMHRFTLQSGESYRVAIRRWSKKAGYHNVVWSLDDAHEEKINAIVTDSTDHHGTLKKVMSDLASKLNMPIRLTASEKDNVLGVYDFDEEPRLTHVKGSSLKSVVHNVVINYGFHWSDDKGNARSWLALNDYQFGAEYYLLTQKNDINSALTTVLSAYPVRSEILESTNQVFILEEN